VDKTKILVLCSGNTARSQMAEALLKKYAGDRFEVHSAGLEPSLVNPFAVRVMEEVGCDMSGHRSKGLDEFLGKVQFGYLITVCSAADEKCPFFPDVCVRLHWPFEDPAAFQGAEEEKLAKFREIRDRIEAKVRSWLVEMSQGES
jgi:arsenate reductase (thioredoxin)